MAVSTIVTVLYAGAEFTLCQANEYHTPRRCRHRFTRVRCHAATPRTENEKACCMVEPVRAALQTFAHGNARKKESADENRDRSGRRWSNVFSDECSGASEELPAAILRRARTRSTVSGSTGASGRTSRPRGRR